MEIMENVMKTVRLMVEVFYGKGIDRMRQQYVPPVSFARLLAATLSVILMIHRMFPKLSLCILMNDG